MNESNPYPAKVVSVQDVEHLKMIRENVSRFLRRVGQQYGNKPATLLDIAPQKHEGARPFFPSCVKIETLDIDPSAGTTYVGDICRKNEGLSDGVFDFIVCTEVLEHTLKPFAAVDELHRLLLPGGLLFLTVPFNFRIHGPLPDCWRFTEHGLRSLFSGWELVELESLETPDRFLMPVHYTVIARRR